MSYLENRFSLTGKTALVTGGHGLYGESLVDAFSRVGARTYIAARNTAALEMLAEKYRRAGLAVHALPLDLSSSGSVDAAVHALLDRETRIDILVNNAVLRPVKSYDGDIANFAQSMQVNATGLFQITRAIGDFMAGQGGGSIINIGSMQGMVGPDPTLYEGLGMTGFIPDYFFHKGGMINLTRFMASYYGQKGVRCNCISPGGVYTEKLNPEFVRRYNARTMLGRMAVPEDITGLAIFLASDAASYITGANIPVDGGYTAK